VDEIDRIYSRAREAGADAEASAKVSAKHLSREQLESEYIALCGMVAYYGKLERDQIGNPIRFYEDIRKWMKQGGIEAILDDPDEARARALLADNSDSVLQILANLRLMLGEFTQPAPGP
jgi:hypothetical protein